MNSWLRLFGIGGAVVALDMWTKRLATAYLEGRPPVDILGEFVRLTYTRNSGVAFGLGAGVPFPYYIFSMAAVAVILYLFACRRAGGLRRQIALSLVLGGAVGNLIDRLASGEVVDFIEIGYGRWHWPVFNVADSAVTIGVILFAITWPRTRESHSEENAGAVGAANEHGGEAGSLPGRGADGPVA